MSNNSKNIIDFINESNNNLFRVNDENDSRYIHDNQINAAKEIVAAFNDNVTRRNHVMLVARMQSGKTGVCNAVVNVINSLHLDEQMGVSKFLFITGMNDCGLKSQTYARVIEQITDANVGNTFFGKRKSRFNTSNRYFVLKNSDLLTFEETLDNSVIFIDECHYGSNENNILTKFLYQHNIDWKNQNNLIQRNIYIVSVSATPFGELISDTALSKKVIELKTNDDYIGVSDYRENGLIHEGKFDDVVGNVTEQLIDAIDRMRQNDEYGVCMVRTRDFEDYTNDMFASYNFEIHEMESNGSKIAYDQLVERLIELKRVNDFNKRFKNVTNKFLLQQKIQTKPILVLIKGAYRAGITLPSEVKDLVYMVYDYSVKSATTAQALLGRMCGYRPKDVVLKTHFFINKKASDMYSDWEGDFSNRENIPCDKSLKSWVNDKNDLSVYDNVELSSKSCGNFAIDLTDAEIEEIFAKCNGKKTCHSNMKVLLPKIFENHSIDIRYDYLNESHVQGKNNYAPSSQEKRFDAFSEDSLVFGFRPDKMKEFVADTNRNYLTNEDFGKRCISVVLDAYINKENGKCMGGNKRLLVYYVEVGAFRVVPNQDSMFEPHKCTAINGN